MGIDIEIEIPKVVVNPKEIEAKIRRLLKEEMSKEGILSKILIILKMDGPQAVSDLTEILQEKFKKVELDRVVVYRAMNKLRTWGLANKASAGEVLIMTEEEKKYNHKYIEARHRSFLSKISPQFKDRYNNRAYFWIANGEGEKYLEWCCQINGYKYEIGKKENKKGIKK